MKLDILFARVLNISLHAYVLYIRTFTPYIYETAIVQVEYKYITVQEHFHRHMMQMNCGTFRDKLLYLLASIADAIITAQIWQKLFEYVASGYHYWIARWYH